MRRTTTFGARPDPIGSAGLEEDTYSFKDVMEGREDEVLNGPADGEKKDDQEPSSPIDESNSQ